MNQLLHHLETQGPALSQSVLGQMYRDPFWMERFGSKGRRHADEDSDFHVRYLVRAMNAGDPHVLVRYARWLRDVLVTRGMCSRHLGENFRLLAEAIGARGWPGGDLAVRFLEEAREALRWNEGPAAELERRREALERAAVQPGLEEPARDLVSYMIDSVALGRPDLFERHVDWMRGHLERRGLPAQRWDALVAALGAQVREACT